MPISPLSTRMLCKRCLQVIFNKIFPLLFLKSNQGQKLLQQHWHRKRPTPVKMTGLGLLGRLATIEDVRRWHWWNVTKIGQRKIWANWSLHRSFITRPKFVSWSLVEWSRPRRPILTDTSTKREMKWWHRWRFTVSWTMEGEWSILITLHSTEVSRWSFIYVSNNKKIDKLLNNIF